MGSIYHIKCHTCEADYVGETERSLKVRFQEHKRPSSLTSDVSNHIHRDQPGHQVNMADTKILGTEPRYFERGVKEAIHINTSKPSLNSMSGRFALPGVWTNLLKKRVRGGGSVEFTVPATNTQQPQITSTEDQL